MASVDIFELRDDRVYFTGHLWARLEGDLLTLPAPEDRVGLGSSAGVALAPVSAAYIGALLERDAPELTLDAFLSEVD